MGYGADAEREGGATMVAGVSDEEERRRRSE